MIDVTHQINAVRRRVGSRVIEAGEGHVVTLSQTYDTTVEDLWDACTNPERIPRWFLPVTGDFRATPTAPSRAATRPAASPRPGSSPGTSPGSSSG
ncbi:hypothetical protein ACPESV_05930 [Streptomyces umbrinus]|uniref:hypothetical protein n=1 Tax=Streptomyces umbrinus TaxID=67370 RepID=UPI003C2F6AC3